MSASSSPPADEIPALPLPLDGDSDSELSDVPTNIELPVSNSRHDDPDVGSSLRTKAKRRRSSRSGSQLWPTTKKRRVAATETDSDNETDYEEDELDELGIEDLEIDAREVSRFESLPREVSHQAVHVTAGVFTTKALADDFHRSRYRPRPRESHRDLSETCDSYQPTGLRDMENALPRCLRLSRNLGFGRILLDLQRAHLRASQFPELPSSGSENVHTVAGVERNGPW